MLGLRLGSRLWRHRRDRRRSAITDTELPHGNAEETIVRLIQRMTRAGFALAAYLNPRQASVVFATPWLAKAVRQEVQRHLALLETRLAEHRDQAISCPRFRVIADADFADEIVQPVLQHVDAVADSSGPVLATTAVDASWRCRLWLRPARERSPAHGRPKRAAASASMSAGPWPSWPRPGG